MNREEVIMKAFKYFILFLSMSLSAGAELKRQTVEYSHGDAVLEGYLVYDDAVRDRRPGVLVVHEWTGINENVKNHADAVAALGYVAFAADIYGKGIRPATTEEAAAQASIYKGDRRLMRERVRAGLDFLRNQPAVDAKRIAAIGYCFGGTTVLELARSGADVLGVVSFHGGLDTPDIGDARQIRAKVLVLHGADDPYEPKEKIDTFLKEMKDAGVDFQMIFYGGAVHSFTNPFAGNDPSKGAAYNEKVNKRSWEAMRFFLSEIFGGRSGSRT
jgi:dienelactone hydrolase